MFDFYKRLMENPEELHVLGNGLQKKSYLYIQDCIDAMLLAVEKAQGKVNILNLGTDECLVVNESVSYISEYMGVKPKISYAGGERGWIGDSPFILLDCSKMRSLGWTPKVGIKDAVIKTLDWISSERWVIDKR